MSEEILLKVYQQRGALISRGRLSGDELGDFCKENSLSNTIQELIWTSSNVNGQSRPELIIETVLQQLKNSRNFQIEIELLKKLYKESSDVSFDQFKSKLSGQLPYGKGEIQRILQFLKRFAVNRDGSVPKDYALKFVTTCKGGRYGLYKPLIYTMNRLILSSAWATFKLSLIHI